MRIMMPHIDVQIVCIMEMPPFPDRPLTPIKAILQSSYPPIFLSAAVVHWQDNTFIYRPVMLHCKVRIRTCIRRNEGPAGPGAEIRDWIFTVLGGARQPGNTGR